MSCPKRIAFAILLAAMLGAAAAQPAVDTTLIESVTGLKGTYDAGEKVFKVSKPRDDIKATVDGMPVVPFLGLTSWAAFKPVGRGSVVMGDTVLLEDEVNPAMSAALDAGLEVTALHNHFFYDQPKIYFMHIAGMGDTRQLAAAVKVLYDRIAQVRAEHPTPANGFGGEVPTPSNVSPGPLAAILAAKPEAKDGMVKFTFGRTTRMHGATMGNQMGVNTWAAFAGTDDNAVVDGDFAMTEAELQPVLRSMRASGIDIVAIHQHMTHETPRIMFLHYWGRGRAGDLAGALRRALDVQRATH